MIPGPRPSQGRTLPPASRGRGPEIPDALGPDQPPLGRVARDAAARSPVTLTRTGRGWTVGFPAGTATAGDLVEGLSLADLVAEECGALVEPDRTARRSARGHGQHGEATDDSPEARIAVLQRTVAQLEHALAARVSTERAIGVLAERHRTGPREAFEALRREARSTGRPVAELARHVLAGLERPAPADAVALGLGVPVTPPALQPTGFSSIPPPPPAAGDGSP